MIPRRILSPRAALALSSRHTSQRLNFHQVRSASQSHVDPDVADPGMNGGYVNPPAQKRILRDPYGDWWDKQERRNFGEPVHEDNDILAVFSTEEYTHAPPSKAFLALATWIAAALGLCAVVYQFYPDKPASSRTFPEGLEKELGGPAARRAPKPGEDDS